MSKSVWGDATQFFFDLSPERILDSIETSTKMRCTGRVFALNSLENRVYDIEVVDESAAEDEKGRESTKSIIAKFYRPGRWSEAQILDEHTYLKDLADVEIPVVAPLAFADGKTLHSLEKLELYYTVFPKVGGRSPHHEDIDLETAEQIGRLIGRMHRVGASHPAPHRLKLDVETYGRSNLSHLRASGAVPLHLKNEFFDLGAQICEKSASIMGETPRLQRIHGDAHLGNLLRNGSQFFWVDFDDMVMGPPVQDIWLLIGGREPVDRQRIGAVIRGYETMHPFDRNELKFIEVLRSLRMIHFMNWLEKRHEDPAFKIAFPDYGTERYWSVQLADLRDQLRQIEKDPTGGLG